MSSVRMLLEKVSYLQEDVRYPKHSGRRGKQLSLPYWLYEQLYEARNTFLHGNPLRATPLSPENSSANLFWLAPLLFRLALTGFLELLPTAAPPDYCDEGDEYYQGIIESALQKAVT